MNYFLLFLAGGLLCNAIPHAVAGLMGTPFPTPFARPPGRGNSAPLTNFLWGAANFLMGLFLVWRLRFTIQPDLKLLAFVAGVALTGTHLSLHFGRVMRGRS